MKKLLIITGLSVMLGVSATSFAQENKDRSVGEKVEDGAKTAAHKTAKGAKVVGNKTAEVASKGASKVADQTFKDKVGPDGQTIYIDGHAKYYYVDKKGHHVYVSKAELKDKPAE